MRQFEEAAEAAIKEIPDEFMPYLENTVFIVEEGSSNGLMGLYEGATAMHAGAKCFVVTLADKGAVYFAAPDFGRITDLDRSVRGSDVSAPIRTELIPGVKVITPVDPTGCGDVWGATYFSRLLAGDMLGDAIRAAHRAAARNVEHRGASGLADHLRGKISVT